MEQFDIAIIRTNNFGNSDDFLTTEQIKNECNNFIHIKNVSVENMMETIVIDIKMSSDVIGDTISCYEDDIYVYQMCYVQHTDNIEKNGVASYLCYDNRIIYGNVAIIKYKINDDYVCENNSIIFDDIINIINKKYIHKGVKITLDNKIIPFEYKKHPLESIDKPDNYLSADIVILSQQYVFFIENEPENDKTNEIATRLAGNNLIKGNVIIVSLATTNIYSDTDINTIKKLSKVLYGKINNRELSGIELKNREKDDNNNFIVMNHHTILNRRYKLYEMKCCSCNNNLDKNFSVCMGCYRAVYDSQECQKKDWTSHNAVCLHNKKPLNLYLRDKKKNIIN